MGRITASGGERKGPGRAERRFSLSVRPYGIAVGCGVVAAEGKHGGGGRGEVTGWTHASARRNEAWLQSVEWSRYRIGYGCTLTVGEVPTQERWATMKKSLNQFARRHGIPLYWNTEWQERGAPHLHIIAMGLHGGPALVEAWLRIAADTGASGDAQDCKAIYDAGGWASYLAKHGARGVGQYQRSDAGRPDGWTKTGRMWGFRGPWATRQNVTRITEKDFYCLRRRIRRYRGWGRSRRRNQGLGTWGGHALLRGIAVPAIGEVA